MADFTLIADAAYKAGFTDQAQLATMIAIAMAESGGVANINNAGTNRNGTVDYGLWQINSVHNPDLDRIYDPYFNAQMAYNVHKTQGYNAWSAYNAGKHAQFMAEASAAASKYLANGVTGQGGPKGLVGEGKGINKKLSGREVGQRVLSGLANAVSSNALQAQLRPAFSTEEMAGILGTQEPGTDDGSGFGETPGAQRGAAALKTINTFLGARNAAYRRTASGEVEVNAEGVTAAAEEAGFDGSVASRIVEAAKQYLGVDYVWGGVSASGMDCSGLVLLVARELGIEMPRVSRDQARMGREVDSADAQMGDLIAFDAGGPKGVVNHIGIIVGRDEQGRLLMIHAPRTGKQVEIVPVTRGDIMTIRRIT